MPFYGVRQAALTVPAAGMTAFVSYDVSVADRDALVGLLRTLTTTAAALARGGAAAPGDPLAPLADNGILGPTVPGGALNITVGVGASLFDERFGLAARKPPSLTRMSAFPNDQLDPARSHGDLSVQVTAAQIDTLMHALRELAKATAGGLVARWRMDGFVSPPRPTGTPRNLLGFKDGIANPDVADAAIADALVWIGTLDGRQAWPAGGSYQVVRIIREEVEGWDQQPLSHQERVIGRHRDSGAPLGASSSSETAVPDYAADPAGLAIPLNAHIRLANPRVETTQASQILRRAWNYDLGLDASGRLDQGLLFTCYQRNIQNQFEAVQTRLIDEPLAQFITPIGGGYFLVLPGVTGQHDFYGRSLLT